MNIFYFILIFRVSIIDCYIVYHVFVKKNIEIVFVNLSHNCPDLILDYSRNHERDKVAICRQMCVPRQRAHRKGTQKKEEEMGSEIPTLFSPVPLFLFPPFSLVS